MATKRDAVAEIERQGEAAMPDIASAPKLILALGRGKTGKSCWVRFAGERALAAGRQPVIADADRTNATLAAFFENVIRPPSAEDEDVRLWLNDLVERQIEERFTCLLDLGGGDLVLKMWARDLELASFLEGHGVVPVAVHFLGSDLDDLSYLRDIETEARFAPQHTVLVLNEGLVPIGRPLRSAFEPIVEHEVFRAATARGARVVRMPRLACMHEVERRRLSFEDAQAGNTKPGQLKLGPVNRQLVTLWRREMETSFAPVAAWLP